MVVEITHLVSLSVCDENLGVKSSRAFSGNSSLADSWSRLTKAVANTHFMVTHESQRRTLLNLAVKCTSILAELFLVFVG
jgi:hypothetical protein